MVTGGFVRPANDVAEGTSVGSSVIELVVRSFVGMAVAGIPVGQLDGSAVASISVDCLEGLPVRGARDGHSGRSAVGAGVGLWGINVPSPYGAKARHRVRTATPLVSGQELRV